MKENLANNPVVIEYQEEVMLNPLTVKRNQAGGPLEVDILKKKKWTEAGIDKEIFKLKEKLVLSAAKTSVKGKGWLEVVSCRNIFPPNPTIEFMNDRSDKFGGMLYFWMQNVKPGSKIQFTIRISGYTSGGAIIKIGTSTPTQYSLTPITAAGSMNLVLGNIMHVPSDPPGNLGLVTLTVNFLSQSYDLWMFHDFVAEEIE